jgi:antitoxin component of MazEF toxin-antitoxin module
MIAKIEEDDEGNAVLTLPDEIIKKFDLKPGDEVNFELHDSGVIIMTFPKEKV